MSAPGFVPPGQSPPFATVTKDEHVAGIIIATAMGIAFTALVLVARVFIRRYINYGWQWDDTSIVISTVLCWLQSVLILVACTDGLGKSLQLIPSHLHGRIQRLYYASNLLYVVAIHLSRISIVLFLHRLTARGTSVRRYTEILLVAVATSMGAFVVAAAFQCGPRNPWAITDQACANWFLQWEIQAIVASVTEVAIFAAPVWLLWHLQKSPRFRLEILAWFGLRLLVLVFTGLRIQSFDKAGFASDPLLHEATYICLTQAELSYSIIAATIPVARTLVTDLVTYYNAGIFGSTVTGGGSGDNSYQMGSLKSSGKRKSNQKNLGGTSNQADNDDADSQEFIIRKDTTIHISREDGI